MKTILLPLAVMALMTPTVLAQRAPTYDPVIEIRRIEPVSRATEYAVRELERASLLQTQKRVSVSNSSELVPDFVQEFVILSKDVATKARGGYQVQGHGTIYVHGDVMYKPKGGDGRTLYGIASVGHSTGPAIRRKW